MENFTTKDVIVDYECNTGRATVRWNLGLDMREWGVKDIDVHVPEQTIAIDWYDRDDDDFDTSKFPETIDLKDVEVSRGDSTDSICPQELSFWKGKWVLQF